MTTTTTVSDYWLFSVVGVDLLLDQSANDVTSLIAGSGVDLSAYKAIPAADLSSAIAIKAAVPANIPNADMAVLIASASAAKTSTTASTVASTVAATKPAVTTLTTGAPVSSKKVPAAPKSSTALTTGTTPGTTTAIDLTGTVDQSVSSIASAFLKTGLIDPAYVEAIGKKNIYSYRVLLFTSFQNAGMTVEAIKFIVHVTMTMKNFKRLQAHFNNASSPDATQQYFVLCKTFITKHCCESTSDTRMPTVKIPESIPEICALLSVEADMVKGISDVATIANKIVTSTWSASLAFDDTLQAANKASVQLAWDSWGLSGKVDKNKQPIKFHDEFYQNQAADKILLLDASFKTVPIPTGQSGYSQADMEAWVQMIFDAIKAQVKTQVISNKNQKTITV